MTKSRVYVRIKVGRETFDVICRSAENIINGAVWVFFDSLDGDVGYVEKAKIIDCRVTTYNESFTKGMKWHLLREETKKNLEY